MKKLFFLSLAATLMLSSCSDVDTLTVDSQSGDQKLIGFTVSSDDTSGTRAAELFCNSELPSGFNVWAICDDDQSLYINNESVTLSIDGTGVLDTPHYWPQDCTLSFVATNKPDAATFTDNTLVFTDYEVTNIVEEQEDLLYAISSNVSESSDSNAPLNFRHALAQVVFKAKCTNTKMHVELSGVGMAHFNNKGSFKLPTDDTTTNYVNHSSSIIGYSSSDYPCGSWSDLSGDKGCFYEFDEPIVISSYSKNLTGGYTYSDEDLYSESSDDIIDNILVVPQSNTAWSASNTSGFYFVVKLCIYNIAGDEFDASTDHAFYGTVDAPLYAYIPANVSWEPGLKYVYTLALATGNGGFVGGNDGKDFNIDNPTETDPTGNTVLNQEEVNLYQGVDYEYVDLGDEFDVYWATTNVGASNVYDYGGYYQWGETSTEYDHVNGYTSASCTTYEIELSDWTGNITYDAATANIGALWRTPTTEEMYALTTKCDMEWVEDYNDSGVNGYLFANKSDSSQYIFLPCASGKDYTQSSGWYGNNLTAGGNTDNRYGMYWTSMPVDSDADYYYSGYASTLTNVVNNSLELRYANTLEFRDMNGYSHVHYSPGINVELRWYGFPIRPVINKSDVK